MSKQICNPLTKYHHGKFPKQKQAAPALQCEMDPIPDCGEKTYQGHGRLEGRKMLVTGGDSGIGRAAAIAYAKEGADVAINYLPYEQKDAEDVAKVIEAVGRKAVLIPGDLSDEAFCKKLVEQAHQKLGGLDNLTLVAGKQTAVEDIMELTTEQIKKTFEINVFSLFWVTKAALGYLKPGSTIITTSSVQAYQPSGNLLDYAATKTAIIAFTRGLANQLSNKGIRVNCVAPGPVWTPLQICGGQPSEVIPEFGKQTPLQRAGQPVELAGVYVHLASEESSYTTAETYGVTGGMHIN
ncbi:SDR family oxidoreductase [Gilliamella apicola]|uniref:SDR family oxidoreductase n=1 Tax=Gilliamella apicola TaxID=1196095 RepID=UPI000A337A92|nr:SDR family oxidoreductase [Gilliamella apicola]OTQ29320.1 NAD(P)-dependent dehydrogenase [Gilliamella apicola]PXY99200.1 KR domain-containing protein [Gilliamella apicola]WLS92567.1 SDR family oxidoreductase [Gilliamella apicola]